MAINFPDSPSNGDTHTAGGKTFTYDSTVGAWVPSAGATTFIGLTDTPNSFGTASQIPAINSGANALEFVALPSSVTVYATVDLLPLSGNSAGDQALVTATNRLYIWNGSGWYNIALINTTPSISGVSNSYDLAIDGTATTVTMTATDPEGLPITYSIASDTSGSIATVTQGTGASSNVFTITPSTNTANAGTFSLTFRASDGVNIATAPASFTLQFSVENSNYTTALITSVGGNNAVNNSFVDSSTNSHSITAAGNATQTTFSPYRSGGYSTYFDGTGDYLTVPSHASMSLDADFTIEYWIYNPTSGNNYIFTLGDSYTSTGIETYIGSSGAQFNLYSAGASQISSATKPTVNAWSHVAVVRSGSTITLYLDGASLGTWTSSATFSGNAHIAQEYFNGAITGTLNGYLTDVRIVKGTALYTAAFTPTTERLTAVTNTSLLTCHLPYIADGSTNGHAITVAGNTKTEPFAPYDYQEYSSSSHGGSMYFDGNDYLTIADNANMELGNSSFTVEAYFYPTSTSGTQAILGKWLASSYAFLFYYSAGTAYFAVNNSLYGSGGTIVANQWNHMAVTRNGDDWNLWLNGSSVYNTTNSLTVNDDGTAWNIGRSPDSGGVYYFNGYIADLRMVKGTALYTAAFTPPTTPLTAITNTQLLLSGTNAGIIDKSQSVKTLTLNGNVSSSTTQSKYLTSSMAFDGTGDYVSVPNETFAFGTGDFTVEFWIYHTSATGNQTPFDNGYTSAGSLLLQTNVNTITYRTYHGSSLQLQESGSPTINTWYHIALVRNGGTMTLYRDGTATATGSYNNNYTYSGPKVAMIGAGDSANGPGDFGISGYISDFRVTKGLARYTANFTAPAAALQG